MPWRSSQHEARARYRAHYDLQGATAYDQWIRSLTQEDFDACLRDLDSVIDLKPGTRMLEVGAGSGGLTMALVQIPDLRLTAMEPADGMIELFQSKPALAKIPMVRGFCDAIEDRSLIAPSSVDVIISRQLTNGLYDPLAAFQNWKYWLAERGQVIVLDGYYGRDAWSGAWESERDQLPLSCTQTYASVAYLLEQAGFGIEFSGPMRHTNELASTRTPRYMVSGRRS